jgi:hypothetical protein
MDYLSFEDWKKEYHCDSIEKCGSMCAWCHLSVGPGWRDWDYCEAYDTSLIRYYYNNHGKLLCDSCNKFEPKNDYQLQDLYQEYVNDFIRNDPERKYNRDKKEFETYEMYKELGIIFSDDVDPVFEDFSE